jgi:hypothetical protein
MYSCAHSLAIGRTVVDPAILIVPEVESLIQPSKSEDINRVAAPSAKALVFLIFSSSFGS